MATSADSNKYFRMAGSYYQGAVEVYFGSHNDVFPRRELPVITLLRKCSAMLILHMLSEVEVDLSDFKGISDGDRILSVADMQKAVAAFEVPGHREIPETVKDALYSPWYIEEQSSAHSVYGTLKESMRLLRAVGNNLYGSIINKEGLYNGFMEEPSIN